MSEKRLGDQAVAFIRTTVPVVVGSLLARLTDTYGIEVSASDEAAVAAGVTGLSIASYYAVVRWLESRWAPAGWLLGVARQPGYAD